MRFRTRFLAVAMLGALAFAPAVALADQSFDTPEECMQSGDAFHMPTCESFNGGKWRASYNDGPMSGPGSGAFGAFVVFALLWGAAPAVICGFIASGRGQSVGLAVLLGIVLGWIGLLIVAFAMKPEVTAAARNVIDNASQPRAPIPAPAPRKNTAGRLTELDSLKQQGLITEAEYTARREAILSEV